MKTFDKDDFCKSLPFQDGVCSGAVVVQVVLAAKTALPYLAVHTAREHERQPRAREHGRLRRLLRRVGDPRSSTRIQ